MSHGKNALRKPSGEPAGERRHGRARDGGDHSGRPAAKRAEPGAPETSGALDASKRQPGAEDPPGSAANQDLPPGLHVVSTPIGNLADMSLRAISTLGGADLILCEDTRVSRTLCLHFAVSAKLAPYHEHNAQQMRPDILRRLDEGAAIALISDAGTPLVSDPGYKLVRDAIAAGHAIHVVPGASALLPALVLSGLPTDRFFFQGFLPPRPPARRSALEQLKAIPATLVFYESAPRLAACLADLALVLGDRPAAVCREITKLHEETRRGTLSSLADHYSTAPPPRGEIVIVVGPPLSPPLPAPSELEAAIRAAIEKSGTRDGVAEVASRYGLAKREVYRTALRLRERTP